MAIRTKKEKAKIAPRAMYPLPDRSTALVSLMQARRACQINEARVVETPLDFRVEGTLLCVYSRHAPKGQNFRATIEGASGWVLWCNESSGFETRFTEPPPTAYWEEQICPMPRPNIEEQTALHEAWIREW